MAKRKRTNQSMLLAVIAAATLIWLILDAQRHQLQQTLEDVTGVSRSQALTRASDVGGDY